MPTKAFYVSLTDRAMSNSHNHILADLFSFDLHFISILFLSSRVTDCLSVFG
jgi:hypothetical protein